MSNFVFTSESVTEGHPDKICDQVSDAILDALLEQDPNSRVACETVVNTGLCLITGEITSKAKVDFINLVREVIKEIGYSGARAGGFDAAGPQEADGTFRRAVPARGYRPCIGERAKPDPC